jgi:hypothetical protein
MKIFRGKKRIHESSQLRFSLFFALQEEHVVQKCELIMLGHRKKQHVRIFYWVAGKRQEIWTKTENVYCSVSVQGLTQVDWSFPVTAVNATEFRCFRYRNITVLLGFIIGVLTYWSENYEKICLLWFFGMVIKRTRHLRIRLDMRLGIEHSPETSLQLGIPDVLGR